jgi:hypothetical protein
MKTTTADLAKFCRELSTTYSPTGETHAKLLMLEAYIYGIGLVGEQIKRCFTAAETEFTNDQTPQFRKDYALGVMTICESLSSLMD